MHPSTTRSFGPRDVPYAVHSRSKFNVCHGVRTLTPRAVVVSRTVCTSVTSPHGSTRKIIRSAGRVVVPAAGRDIVVNFLANESIGHPKCATFPTGDMHGLAFAPPRVLGLQMLLHCARVHGPSIKIKASQSKKTPPPPKVSCLPRPFWTNCFADAVIQRIAQTFPPFSLRPT